MVEEIKYVGEIGVKAISEIVETKLATKANTDDVNTALSTKASVAALNALSDTVTTKVDKVDGKGLSTNDFDNDYKTKLTGIDEGAEVNVQGDWSENDSTKDSYIQNRTHYKNDDDTYVKLDENYIPDTIARKSAVDTKVDKVTTATSGNIVKFGEDGAIADSELTVADIATRDLLSDNVSSTNRALSAEEIDEKIQQNSAAIVGANSDLSAGFQIQSSQYHSSLTTLTCLEDGPWYKSHNGEVVECGEKSGVYVENNDVATVLNDETLFYFYANNNRYQRVKLGDPEYPWGKITLPSGNAVYLEIDATTMSKPCLWFHDNTGVTEEYKGKVFMAYLDELPRKKQIVYEYDNCSTLAETEGVTPQGPYDVTFPTSIYYCVMEQTNDRKPKWILRTSIDNMALTSSQFASLNSGATKEKIDQIALNTESISGKQDAFEHVTEENNILKIDEDVKVTSNDNTVVNIGKGALVEVKTKHYQGSSKISFVSGDGGGSATATLSSKSTGGATTNLTSSADGNGATSTTIVSASSEHSSNVDIKAAGGMSESDTVKINITASGPFTSNNININAEHPSQYGTSSVNITADKINATGEFTITGTLKGGFKALKNETMVCTPDVFWYPSAAIACSGIIFNDDDYYETNLSYTFQGYFVSIGSYSIKTTTKNGLSINWFGDYDTEAGNYEFSVRRVSETSCIGIITKLEK